MNYNAKAVMPDFGVLWLGPNLVATWVRRRRWRHRCEKGSRLNYSGDASRRCPF